MYNFLHNLLSDKREGAVFSIFGTWHFFYILLTIISIAIILFLNKEKNQQHKQKICKILVNIAFTLYILDFFLMPIAYGEIDIEKLPFHVCTAMCVMCFLSYHVQLLSKYRISFVILGFISNVVYLIYPAGVMWHGVHPLSYRVIQTLIFHSIMTIYGFISIVYEHNKIEIKKCYQDLIVIIGMTAWALLGNYTYNGVSEEYSHIFNWFFVVRDPFYVIDETAAPFVMPILNIALFFSVEILLHLIVLSVKRIKSIKSYKKV